MANMQRIRTGRSSASPIGGQDKAGVKPESFKGSPSGHTAPDAAYCGKQYPAKPYVDMDKGSNESEHGS